MKKNSNKPKSKEKYISTLESRVEELENFLDIEVENHEKEINKLKGFVSLLYKDLETVQNELRRYVRHNDLDDEMLRKFYDRYKDKTWDLLEKWKKRN